MPAPFDAASAVIFLSALGLLAVVAIALAAYVATGRSERPAVRPGARGSSAASVGILRPS
jgi:hypothetical protein